MTWKNLLSVRHSYWTCIPRLILTVLNFRHQGELCTYCGWTSLDHGLLQNLPRTKTYRKRNRGGRSDDRSGRCSRRLGRSQALVYRSLTGSSYPSSHRQGSQPPPLVKRSGCAGGLAASPPQSLLYTAFIPSLQSTAVGDVEHARWLSGQALLKPCLVVSLNR